MGDVEDDCKSCKKDERKQPTACILCTILLLGLLILLLILYFSLFKPRDPRVQIPTMQLLSYSPISGSSAASISLSLQVSIYNPNRGDFIIQEGSTACLYYQNQQVGFTPIPPSTIPAQSYSTNAISMSTASALPLVPDGSAYYAGAGIPSYGGGVAVPATATSAASLLLQITTSVTIMGHVTTANLFSHHSDVVSKCTAAVSVGSPKAYIWSYTCQRSYSLDD